MRDNYLFQRICRECDKWEQEVKGKMVCDSKPYDTCLWCFLDLIKDVDNDCVTSDGLIFCFDEIKPVVQVRGDL